MQKKKRFNWLTFILGLLMVFVGFYAFMNPTVSLVGVAFVFGIAGILRGIYQIYIQRKISKLPIVKEQNISTGLIMLVGIINIVIGLFILINWKISIVVLPMAFAIWFLADSIADLFTLPAVKKIDNSLFWLKLIVDILAIISGIILIANPISSALTVAFLVGFYFTMKGIEHIVNAFNSDI